MICISKWRAWGILIGLSLLTTGFIAYVIAPAGIFPVIMDEFGIDKPTASASISVIFLTWAILQIPGGYILDRYDNRKLVQLGGGIFLLSGLIGVFVSTYWQFLVTRLVSGIGVVFIFIGGVTILNQILPEQRQGFGISIFVASPPFGVAIALFTGARLTNAIGWRLVLLSYIVLASIGYLIFLVLLKQPITADNQITIKKFITTFRKPSILLVSIASLASYTIWTFLTTWMPTYGNEILELDLATAGAASALIPLAGIISRPTGGGLSDFLDGRLKPIIISSFLVTMVVLFRLGNASSSTTFFVLLALSGASVNLAVGLYLVYINALADKATQGTSLSIMMTFSQIGNLSAPVIGGWLITHFSWTVAFGFTIVLTIVGIIAIIIAKNPIDGTNNEHMS